jgi:hypothetical protein
VPDVPSTAFPTRFPFHVPASFKYGAEALALLGIAFGLIKWVGRTLRSLISDRPFEAARLEGLASHSPAAAADALIRQGIVSAEQIERMTPREREFLVATAGPQLKAANTGTAGRRLTPVRTDAVVAGTKPPRERSLTPTNDRSVTPPRLHLITPTRPPLGMTVHCPGCGAPLDRDGLQRTGTTTCPRCKRPVSAHIQRGRLTVIIDETPEEAEHRKRVEG